MEEYPSPAEGIGLENRQGCNNPRGFESLFLLHKIKIWPIGQAVKTPPFHGGNRGSNPLWVTNYIKNMED
jgi:hypothetical protein